MPPLISIAGFLQITIQMSKFVAARFCEGGHICTLPRECCTQGCCPAYHSNIRQLPPAPSDHVLNLFFISHWFFWCVVVAIILAILCAYSLWKRRRTLCGWGFSDHHAQSEGDSAGSCYAPPQYSRCNSFLHPPPPYTEVTSKPDLYPLVYTCNGGDGNGKSGSNYLMVQYFRNYIVRPAGSLSAASTVDSLSSSFICNINEANTLVPPPYSRAASPDIGFGSHLMQHYVMPRSASQVVCQNIANSNNNNNSNHNNSNTTTTTNNNNNNNGPSPISIGNGGALSLNTSQEERDTANVLLNKKTNCALYTGTQQGVTDAHMMMVQSSLNGHVGSNMGPILDLHYDHYHSNTQALNEVPLSNENEQDESSSNFNKTTIGRTNDNNNNANLNVILSNSMVAQQQQPTSFVQSHSDQQFQYITNSNSSLSDIFLNNSCAAIIGGGNVTASCPYVPNSDDLLVGNNFIDPNTSIASNLSTTNSNPQRSMNLMISHQRGNCSENNSYDSSSSVGAAATVPTTNGVDILLQPHNNKELRDLQILRRSLETCCQLLQQQQQQHQQQQQQQDELVSVGTNESPVRMAETIRKYLDDGQLRGYLTSSTCSGVSSLANIGTPNSPPQATSPTGEVKEILDQIRQLQEGVCRYEEDLYLRSTRPLLQHTVSSPNKFDGINMEFVKVDNNSDKLQRVATMPEQTLLREMAKEINANRTKQLSNTTSKTTGTTIGNRQSYTNNNSIGKRPSSLQQSGRKRFYMNSGSKISHKGGMYTPMMMASNSCLSTANRCPLKSPIGNVVVSNFLSTRNSRLSRKGWASRSAPTTPATSLPPTCFNDDSPLLHEHDEDQEDQELPSAI